MTSRRGMTDTSETEDHHNAALSLDLDDDSSVDDDLRTTTSNIPSLVCAFLASLTTGGTTYAFSIYGDDLKHSLGLKQSELDTISTAFFFAGLLSWAPGLFADKLGVRFAMATGGITGAIATGTFWMIARQFILVPRFAIIPILSTLAVILFLSCASITGSVFRIIVSSCGAGTKGSAVGAAKGYVGLGAGVYSCLFESLRSKQQSTLDFLPMAGFFFILCATIPALYFLPTNDEAKTITTRDDATPKHFRTLYLSLVALAIIAVGDSMLGLYRGRSEQSNDESGRNILTSLVIVSLWLMPILYLLYLPRADHQQVSSEEENAEHGDGVFTESQSSDHRIEEENLLAGDHTSSSSRGEMDDHIQAVVEIPDLNTIEMLQTPSALLLLWTTTILVGAGTVETNNLAQMVESLGFKQSVSQASTTFFSVAQAFSRVLTGSMSEAALNWNVRGFFIERGIPRPFFLVIASIVGTIAHFILGLATQEFFFVFGSTLSGAAFGMVWPLMVLIVGEAFGTKNVGANYMLYDGGASAAGTLLLSSFVASDIYEDHIHKDAEDQSTCFGADCFRATHMIVAALSFSCVATSIGMMYTSRRVYNSSRLHVH